MAGELANVPWTQEEAESGGTWGVVTYRGRWIHLDDGEGWRFLDCEPNNIRGICALATWEIRLMHKKVAMLHGNNGKVA